MIPVPKKPNEMSEEIKCPRCKSNQITANKKGFSVGKAAAGALLTGGVGLLAGTIGSNKVVITCLACGHQFKPGAQKETAAEQYHRLKAAREKIEQERREKGIVPVKPKSDRETKMFIWKMAMVIALIGIILWFLSPILGYIILGLAGLVILAAIFGN